MRKSIWLVFGLLAASLLAGANPSGSQRSVEPKKGADLVTRGKNGFPLVDFSRNRRGAKAEGYLLSAHLAASRVAPEGKVVLKLVLKNTRPEVRQIGQAGSFIDYVLFIEPPLGEPVVIDHRAADIARNLSIGLKANEELTEEYPVSDKYKFSAPGRYRITAARSVGTLDGRSESQVVSNTVTLTVSKDVKAEPRPKSDK